METSNSIAAIGQALSVLQGKLEHAGKNASGYGYHYADLAAVLDVARPLLAENGLALSQWPTMVDGAVSVESLLVHSSGEWIRSSLALPIEGKKGMSRAQEVGSVITYARRYAMSAILGIAQVDDDAAGTKDDEPPPRQAPTPAPQGDGISGSAKQGAMIWALASKLFGENAKQELESICQRRGWPLSSKELTSQQCSTLIVHLQKLEASNGGA